MALAITTLPAAAGVVGTPYSSAVVATGGTAPYTYASTIGTPPLGLTLNPSTGAITGTPTTRGVWTFQLRVTDSLAAEAFETAHISISGGSPSPVGNPVAAHTFDFVRVYLSTRSPGAPGAGGWSSPVKIFDGWSDPGPPNSVKASTFSAGALTGNLSESRGIVCKAGLGGSDVLMYLGDGLPTLPKLITWGAGNTVDSVDYWDVSQGAFTFGGNRYLAGIDASVFPNKLFVLESTDDGDNWNEVDSVNAPDTNAIGAMQRIDDMLYFFTCSDGSFGTNYAIESLKLGVGWQVSIAPMVAATIGDFGLNTWSNGLFKFLNGDFGVLYRSSDTGAPAYRQYNGSWQAEVALPAIRYANSVIDLGLQLIHVWTYEAFGGKDAAIHYSTVAQDGTVIPDIFIIPATISPTSDGVGKCSIQNGLLFCPRDDNADFDNSVWVADLSDGQFFKELLPVPVGETDEIKTSSIGAPGSGYVAFDIGTINGGINPAEYQILTVNGFGAVLTYVIILNGGGYAPATGVSTTPLSGGGSGFTIDILTVGGKTPSCAYMMFPNGYQILTLALACPVAPLTATVGVLYTSSAPVVTGGTGPFTFALLSGPFWMSIDPATGIVSGTPAVTGPVTYTIAVTDSLGATASVTAPCPLTVSSGAVPPPAPPFCIINPIPGTGPTVAAYNEPLENQGS